MSDNFLHKDPFPKIVPSLLNSADIEDYITKTKMVEPFDPKKLKSASYEVGFDGIVYFWDELGEPEKKDLKNEKSFILKKNSIAFLFTKTKFRLPDYIAIRFNLKITHVHRGILLGTGPLVDPGFEGNLLIPLHNLTTNDYTFKVGEGLIWVEFTKLSENSRWVDCVTEAERCGSYIPFPPDKKNKGANYYFGKASMGKGIRSSIPDAMKETAEDAKKAREDAKKASNAAEEARRSTKKITFRGTVGIILAVCALIISLYMGYQPILQIVNDSIKYVKDEHKYYEERGANLIKEVNSLKSQLRDIQSSISSNEKRFDQFDKKLTDLESATIQPKSEKSTLTGNKNISNNSTKNLKKTK